MSEHNNQLPAGALPGTIDENDIPVLHDVVFPDEIDELPALDPAETIYIEAPVMLHSEPAPQPDLAHLTDTLRDSLGQELDGAIDHAVHEQLQAAMDEVASNIKHQVRAQLEALLPDLIDAAIHQDIPAERK